MTKKETITNLVNAGFTLEEALKLSADPLEETPEAAPEEQEAAPEEQEAAPEEQEAAPEAPSLDVKAIMAALDGIKASIETMTEVTRATARLYGTEKKTGESAEDILARLG